MRPASRSRRTARRRRSCRGLAALAQAGPVRAAARQTVRDSVRRDRRLAMVRPSAERSVLQWRTRRCAERRVRTRPDPAGWPAAWDDPLREGVWVYSQSPGMIVTQNGTARLFSVASAEAECYRII